MRKKTKNNQNQGSNAKKKFFLVPKSPTQMGVLCAKNSHAWAPLKELAKPQCQITNIFLRKGYNKFKGPSLWF